MEMSAKWVRSDLQHLRVSSCILTQDESRHSSFSFCVLVWFQRNIFLKPPARIEETSEEAHGAWLQGWS